MAENGLGYLFPVFGLSYVTQTLGMPRQQALDALMLSFIVQLLSVPLFSALSDRIGRRPGAIPRHGDGSGRGRQYLAGFALHYCARGYHRLRRVVRARNIPQPYR